MNILFIAPSGMRGGHIVLRNIIEDRLKKGDRVFAIIPQEGPAVNLLKEMGVEVKVWNLPPWRKFFLYPLNILICLWICAFIKIKGIDLVYINNLKLVPFGVIPSRWLGIPSVFHLHDVFDEKKCRKYDADKCTHIICVSKICFDNLGKLSSKTSIIPNGVNFDLFKEVEFDRSAARRKWELPVGKTLIGYCGKISKKKGFDLFLEAAQNLKNTNLNFQFIVIGGLVFGDLYDDWDAFWHQVKEFGLEDLLIAKGFLEDPFELIALMDVLVIPSREESFGLTVIEGMALESLVVAARIDGPKDIIDDGKTGFLFESNDAKALEEGILKAVRCGNKEEIKKAARDFVFKNYNISAQHEKIDLLLNQLVSIKRS